MPLLKVNLTDAYDNLSSENRIGTGTNQVTPGGHKHEGADILSAVNNALSANNADTVDGYHASEFATIGNLSNYLPINDTAQNSYKLGGVLPAGYSLSGHNHDFSYLS